VFTKLNAWTLTSYQKVILLDIDIIPLGSLSELFDLEPPAALVRGPNDRRHGEKIDGRRFFSCWGQTGGINAGVILLEPSDVIFGRMLYEVTSPTHPSHIPGAGPEQDYLTRFFASDRSMCWSHIDVVWNYQPHHVLFSLEAAFRWDAYDCRRNPLRSEHSDLRWLPRRLSLSLEDIRVVHLSGELKPWHMLLQAGAECDTQTCVGHWSDLDIRSYAEQILKALPSYRLWISQDASDEEYREFSCKKRDGKIILDAGLDVTDVVVKTVSQLRELIVLMCETWKCCARLLLEEQESVLSSLRIPQLPGYSLLLAPACGCGISSLMGPLLLLVSGILLLYFLYIRMVIML
jgi:hypothetical protein